MFLLPLYAFMINNYFFLKKFTFFKKYANRNSNGLIVTLDLLFF